MLQYVTGEQLLGLPKVRHTMLLDRRTQFIDRLKWDLAATKDGYETDQYDRSDSIYIISVDENGRHKGSMRFLPTNGSTMVSDHFSYVIPGIEIKSPSVWECTRLCVSQHAEPSTAVSLLAGSAKMMREFKINAFIGVFNAATERVYKRFSSEPIVLGSNYSPAGKVSVGLWGFSAKTYESLVAKSGYSHDELELMFVNSELCSSGKRFSALESSLYEV